VKNDLVQIDKAGRVVLPKAVREHLGLQAGDHLQLNLHSGGVELRPAKPGPWLEEDEGLLVLKGVAWAGQDPDLVTPERETRLEELTQRSVAPNS